MMVDVICLGVAVVDLFLRPVEPDCFENQTTTLISDIGICAGGDAVNQAVMLSKLGNRTSLLARVGADDMGELLVAHLKRVGVNLTNVIKSEESHTTTAVALVRKNGQRAILNIRGNNFDFCKEDVCPENLPKAKALSVGSIFGMPRLEQDGGLLKILETAKQRGMLTFADMASDKYGQKLKGVKPFLPYLDYFLPSYAEAASLTGERRPEEMARIFHRCGARYVAIKMGGEGVYLSSGGWEKQIPAYAAQVVDTTGAGDTFCAGLIHSVLAGCGFEEAGRFACAAASFSTQYQGASLAPLTLQAVEAFRAKRDEKSM